MYPTTQEKGEDTVSYVVLFLPKHKHVSTSEKITYLREKIRAVRLYIEMGRDSE